MFQSSCNSAWIADGTAIVFLSGQSFPLSRMFADIEGRDKSYSTVELVLFIYIYSNLFFSVSRVIFKIFSAHIQDCPFQIMTPSRSVTFKAGTFLPVWVCLWSSCSDLPFCSLPVKSTGHFSLWALVLYWIASRTCQTVSSETVPEGLIPRLTSLPWIVTRNRFLFWCCSVLLFWKVSLWISISQESISASVG